MKDFIFDLQRFNLNITYTTTDDTSSSVSITGTTIQESNFSSLKNTLKTVTIPEGVTSIGDYAFNGCSNLQSITIPEGVTSIGYGAFGGCSSLTSITIPSSVTSIGEGAFYNCENLTSVTFAENSQLTSIGEIAFASCSNLTSITIPENVETIESYAFQYCSSLTSVNFEENSLLTSIGYYAFNGCTNLTSINIPEGVTSIGGSAFTGCRKLISITIPSNVTQIDYSAFQNCNALTEVTFAENSELETIGARAFYNCSGLTSIKIPSSVTSIGNLAFFGCSNLTEVTFNAEDPSGINFGQSIFGSSPSENFRIYVPASALDAYKTKLSSYADKIFAVGGGENDGEEENKKVWTFSNGIATYTENGEKKIEITGLKNAENIVVNENAKTATISAENFDAKDISISGDFTLKLDKNYPIKTTAAHFENFTYKSASSTEGYTLSDDKKSVTYTAEVAEENLFTLTGVKNTKNIAVDAEKNIVTLTAANLDKQNVTISGDFTLALAENVSLVEEKNTWQVSGGTAILKNGTTAGYTLSTDAKNLNYAVEVEGETLATITGLKNSAKTSDFSFEDGVITLTSGATGDGEIKIFGNGNISGGIFEGVGINGRIIPDFAGDFTINGVTISAKANDIIIVDHAKIPYLYDPTALSEENLGETIEETITKNVSEEDIVVVNSETSVVEAQDNAVIINNDTSAEVSIAAGENTTIKASGGAKETIDLEGGKNSVVIADNGAKVTNYDVTSFAAFLMSDFSNILAAIRNQSITFDNNNINFFGKNINFNEETASGEESFAANLYNNNKTEIREIGWTSNSGGTVDDSESKKSKVLVGNYGAAKSSASLQGGRGNDFIFAGSGDTINSGSGNNSIELLHNEKSDSGAKISVSESRGVDKISGFTDGYDDNSDKISVSNAENLQVGFKNGKLQIKNGERKMIFDNVNKTASSADAENLSHSDTDSGDVVRFLVDAENISADAAGESESLRYAVAGENSTIRVENWTDEADIYIGAGKTSALDFEQYNAEVEINLSDSENYQNFGMVVGGFKNHTLIGSAERETLIAGTGHGSLWGAGGNDLLSGYNSGYKEYGSTFYFVEGDGKDTITNFEAFDEYWTHTADTLSTAGQEITGVYVLGDDVEFKVGSDRDFVRIVDAKNKLLLVDDGELRGYRVGDSLAYDDYTTDFYGKGTATISISDYVTGDLNIWLDGSDGKNYENIKILDASNFENPATLAGGANSEKIFASKGNTSLWGGIGGNDTLIGGSGDDEFFYSFGNGKDIINGATENDVVNIFNTNLSQITKIEATNSQIKISFSDNGSLTINSAENVGFKYQGTTYQLDRQNKTWSAK